MSGRKGSTKEGEKSEKSTKSRVSYKVKAEECQKKLKKANKEIEELKERLLRRVAELDNYRKRTEREIANIIQNANENLIKDILPVVDDLERSLKISNSGEDDVEFRKGVELIYQKLMLILGKYGLEPMESVGTEFDVEKHDALLQISKKGTPAGVVVEEHEKGYLLNGRVLRHAKVVVSK